MASKSSWASRPELDIPLSRLDFLHSISPPDVTPITRKLLEKHWAAPPEQTTLFRSDESPSDDEIRRLLLINEIADLTGEEPKLTEGLATNLDGITSMRDLARNFSQSRMVEIAPIDSSYPDKPSLATALEDGSQTGQDRRSPSIVALQQKLFHQYSSAVIARMVHDGEIVLESHGEATTAITANKSLALEATNGREENTTIVKN